MVFVDVFREDKSIPLPEYQHEGDAGFDLASAEDVVVYPNSILPTKISTGLRFGVPSGFVLEIHSRSGFAAKNHVFVTNSPGVIDSSFRGIVQVLLTNLGEDPLYIKKGDRIAQGVIKAVPLVKFLEVDKLTETERGEGGFGSSGVK